MLPGQEVPRTHDWVKLEAVLAKLGLQPPVGSPLLDQLTRFAIDDKYPRKRAAPVTREEAAALIPPCPPRATEGNCDSPRLSSVGSKGVVQ